MGYLILPEQDWSKSALVPAATLNEVATSAADVQLTVAADRAPLRVIYGRVRLGAQVANVLSDGSNWIVQAIWGEGEIDSIESIWVNDQLFTGTATHYTGTTGQTVNATLVSLFAGVGIDYTDALPGVAYSVISVPVSLVSGMPQIAAIVKGRRLYDARDTLTDWSDNPALAIADFLSSTQYGLGMTVDWPSVTTVANECDALVDGVKRRTLGLVIDSVQSARAWVETLRTYAGCWVHADAGTAKLIADRPRSTDKSILHASGHIASIGRISKRGTANLPNRVEVRYTDTSAVPWRDASVFSPSMGLPTGMPDSQVALPGIQSASQAMREAIERLNKLWLSDLSIDGLTIFDDGLAVEVGDVIAVSHPFGLDAKKLRVMSVANDYGRFRIAGHEYDPAVYSDAVATGPTYPDTQQPNPAAPPVLSGFAVVEEAYQLENGTWSSRLRATWSVPVFPFAHRYYVEVLAGETLIVSGNTEQAAWVSPPVQEGTHYTVRACIVSSIGASGEWTQATITALGKSMIPGNVPSVSVFEAGGRVYVSWQPAVDVDIWRYEVRYGSTGGSWDAATLIDRVDALRLTSDQLPAGAWKIHVKALDSVGQYSTTAATANVTVTSDAGSFLIDTVQQTAPTTSGMATYTLAPEDTTLYYITEDGVAFGTRFSSNLSTYTSALASYAAVASEWLGEAEDLGQSLSGQWTGTADILDVGGAHVSYIGLSPDMSTWDYFSGLSQKQTARGARLKHTAASGSVMRVAVPTQSIRIDAVPRYEVGSGTSATSGRTTISLTGKYTAAKSVSVDPEGSTARYGSPDNIRINGYASDAIQVDCEVTTAATNQYVRYTIASGLSYTIQTGDRILYECMVAERPAAEAALRVVPSFYFSDATYLGAVVTLPDFSQMGVWNSVDQALTGAVGKTINKSLAQLSNMDTGVGVFKGLLRNIRIMDSTGLITRLTVWSSGSIDGGVDSTSTPTGNIRNHGLNNANAFDAYVFDNAGSRLASPFRYRFEGI